LLYVGRVAHEKNIDFLVHMFKKVLTQIPNALLLIVGEGPAQPHLRELVRTTGVAESVRFIGYLERDSELLDCYQAGDLFVFASRTETQGLVLLEALAQGTPVVSTVHMGTRDVLEHARGARIVDDNLDAFANAATELLNDNVTRTRLSMVAPGDAAKWSSREMAERLVRLYTQSIESKRAPSIGGTNAVAAT
jgi:1,2-diacylglycerol 3-alpha-glucosyltransferase